ncbi:hypothetical protein [Bacteroides reticulotermitis]|uniref:Uncharacterized protein n=1 Tax=Bacteroides reticulotermitis JCM 10512 TaxID=1445607 RepID=W4US58_9BACE|nr:hypothetical protein [Bacteroides reticulotermitis]GAE83354.1 hypothetical protein JCM10512_1622 [Bacteroides reticulotermitis JCM 10512]
MKVEEFIEQESFVVVNPDYPVISVEKAWEAIDMERRNVKEEAVRHLLNLYHPTTMNQTKRLYPMMPSIASSVLKSKWI